MTRGPGRSDCYRIGVTYGYRECLRRGPGQASSAVYSPIVYEGADRRRTYVCGLLIQNIFPSSKRHYRRRQAFRSVSW